MARRAYPARRSGRGVYRQALPVAYFQKPKKVLPAKTFVPPPTGFIGWGIKM